MPEANLQPCTEVLLVRCECDRKREMEKWGFFPVCRENAKQDGASWWQCLPGIRAGTALGGDFAASAHFAAVLTSSCPFSSYSSSSLWLRILSLYSLLLFEFWRSTRLGASWNVCHEVWPLHYLLLIEQKWVREGSWWMSKLILQLLTKSWKNGCRSIVILWHGHLFTTTWNEISHLIS